MKAMMRYMPLRAILAFGNDNIDEASLKKTLPEDVDF